MNTDLTVKEPRRRLWVLIIMLVVGSVLLGHSIGLPYTPLGNGPTIGPQTAADPPSPEAQHDPRVAAALANATVRSLLDGKKYRVLFISPVDSKGELPEGTVNVEIFDYTDNFGLYILVGPGNEVLDVIWPRSIAVAPVEEQAAYTAMELDLRFQRLAAGHAYRLSTKSLVSGPRWAPCDSERCVFVHLDLYDLTMETPPTIHNGTIIDPGRIGGYRSVAYFIVNLNRDIVVAAYDTQWQPLG